ncbi:MAG: DUF3137 domain-containing protein [Cyanobacteria bacterium J06639_16]
MAPTDGLLQAGIKAVKENQFQLAVGLLERYCHLNPDSLSVYTLQAQMYLVKAYKENGQQQQAFTLCQQLTRSHHAEVKAWSCRMLPHLTPASSAPQKLVSGATLANANQAVNALGVLGLDQNFYRPTPPPTPPAPDPKEIQLKTVTKFKRHYEQELLAGLEDLEAQRRSMVSRGVLYVLIFFIVIILISILTLSIPFQIFVGGVVLLFQFEALLYRPYRKNLKEKVIYKILKFIDPNDNFSYSHHSLGRPNKRAFIESRLFGDEELKDFSEEDCVEGQWGETRLYFSETKAERKGGDEQSRIIFHGLFFQANFNKSFQGRTVVVPDTAENFFGPLGRALQYWNKRHANELIKLEDPEFERLFAVYGTDQIEARYVLSTSLMQRLVDLQHKIGKDIRIAFVNNSVYIAIPYEEDLFEPPIFTSILTFQPILEYFQTLQMMIGIVEDLNLNRRIWQ